MNNVAVVKIFFHPGSDINRAMAEASASSQSILRVLPPAPCHPRSWPTAPPPYRSCNWRCPARHLSEQQIYDLGNNSIRTRLATVQGAAVPLPFGGKVRQVMVDINSQALQSLTSRLWT